MAPIVKSNFLPSAPCKMLILLDKKRVWSCNSSLIIKGLRLIKRFNGHIFSRCNSSLIIKGLRLLLLLSLFLWRCCNSSLIIKGLRLSNSNFTVLTVVVTLP